MKMPEITADTIAEVEDIMFDEGYTYAGVRIQEQPFELGELDHESVRWVNREETDEGLGGVCVTDIHDLATSLWYFGDHAAIVCGNSMEWGNDPGERIIHDPVVVMVLS